MHPSGGTQNILNECCVIYYPIYGQEQTVEEPNLAPRNHSDARLRLQNNFAPHFCSFYSHWISVGCQNKFLLSVCGLKVTGARDRVVDIGVGTETNRQKKNFHI